MSTRPSLPMCMGWDLPVIPLLESGTPMSDSSARHGPNPATSLPWPHEILALQRPTQGSPGSPQIHPAKIGRSSSRVNPRDSALQCCIPLRARLETHMRQIPCLKWMHLKAGALIAQPMQRNQSLGLAKPLVFFAMRPVELSKLK